MKLSEIKIANGQVQRSNFPDYPLLTLDEMPEVEVQIIPSKRNPQGAGEMGIPPTAPAGANTVYAACGERIRKLPLEVPGSEEIAASDQFPSRFLKRESIANDPG